MKIAMVPFGLSRKSIKKGEEVMKKVLFVLLFVVAALVLVSGQSYAISGACGSCHTMHNSQGGVPMNYNNSATPNAVLLRGDCLGCHAQNTASNGPSSANSIPPQVLHQNGTDLAGGNFDNVVTNETRGHNVVGVVAADSVLGTAPGGTQALPVTCAGGNGAVVTGCHGSGTSVNQMTAMSGSHHGNVGGQLNTATTVANSYRFLLGVKGTEDTDWQHTSSAADHNEYFSDSSAGIDPAGFGISKLCARCHTNFHDANSTFSGGEWIRHPTEIAIGATYAGNYTATYSTTVPVGRTAVAAASGTVDVVGGTDTVVCMSCHVAHGSGYADAMRWDYANNTTGDGVGCNKCHAK